MSLLDTKLQGKNDLYYVADIGVMITVYQWSMNPILVYSTPNKNNNKILLLFLFVYYIKNT